jgi:hypothetical protein
VSWIGSWIETGNVRSMAGTKARRQRQRGTIEVLPSKKYRVKV